MLFNDFTYKGFEVRKFNKVGFGAVELVECPIDIFRVSNGYLELFRKFLNEHSELIH